MVDPIDEYAVQQLEEFDGKKLRSINEEGLDIEILCRCGDEWFGMETVAARRKINPDIVFVDDVVFVVMAGTPIGVWRLAPKVASIVINTFLLHGLMVNTKPNKTEIMFEMRGQRQCFVRQELAAQQGHVITSEGICIRVVKEYVHLGTRLTDDLNPTADLNRRIASANASYIPLCSAVFWKS